MSHALYIETSVVLSCVLEQGLSGELEGRMRQADTLVTSHLTQVEVERTLLKVEEIRRLSPQKLDQLGEVLHDLWSHCEIWQLTSSICQTAGRLQVSNVLPMHAFHIATFLEARRHLPNILMLTNDSRLQVAVTHWWKGHDLTR